LRAHLTRDGVIVTFARVRSVAVTLLLWTYFVGAFLAGYWVVFLIAGMLRGQRGLGWALRSYTRGFLAVVRLAIPRLVVDIPEQRDLSRTRGTVAVCNHLSFLDPLLMLALLPRLITIVRPDFFRVPIFGWLLRGAGFLGPDLFSEGQAWVDRVARHLRHGGNLLIFPEGTRSRDGRLAPFKKGAFYLAKHLSAPILVLRITGTDSLFAPGRLTFDVDQNRAVGIRRLALISQADADLNTTHELTARVWAMLDAG
jgi:1-acyl-sn-glycerol-3-phosphate acyltransferase